MFGLLIMSLSNIQVDAEVTSDVIITSDIDLVQSKQQISGSIYVNYSNISLYNDMVKLSYHIYDKDNNVLIFENERMSFTLIDGKAMVDININLNDKKEISDMKNLIIRFDLVDEKNLFWYNDNPNVNIQTLDIQYSNTLSSRFKQVIKNVFPAQIIQTTISISFIFIFIVVLNKMKKSK